MMDAWVLVGMMGAGKSTIGHMLAERSGREFVDTDKLIERHLGRPISKFFQYYGEEAFRDHETAIIRALKSGPFVVATGGGAIVRDANFDHIKAIGKVIYLKSEPEELIRRLQKSKKKRPLLNADDWESTLVSILERRKERYEQANIVVNVDEGDQDVMVDKLIRLLGENQ